MISGSVAFMGTLLRAAWMQGKTGASCREVGFVEEFGACPGSGRMPWAALAGTRRSADAAVIPGARPARSPGGMERAGRPRSRGRSGGSFDAEVEVHQGEEEFLN